MLTGGLFVAICRSKLLAKAASLATETLTERTASRNQVCLIIKYRVRLLSWKRIIRFHDKSKPCARATQTKQSRKGPTIFFTTKLRRVFYRDVACSVFLCRLESHNDKSIFSTTLSMRSTQGHDVRVTTGSE